MFAASWHTTNLRSGARLLLGSQIATFKPEAVPTAALTRETHCTIIDANLFEEEEEAVRIRCVVVVVVVLTDFSRILTSVVVVILSALTMMLLSQLYQ